jgi:hypothetical protein
MLSAWSIVSTLKPRGTAPTVEGNCNRGFYYQHGTNRASRKTRSHDVPHMLRNEDCEMNR